jgi:hypothetical protein
MVDTVLTEEGITYLRKHLETSGLPDEGDDDVEEF